ncbi:MAG: fibronectin type III domain-containing protein, partial [Ruminococcus sp.]|nr:fibronectin type III domain-containing protein [Ruminococcus sp.]
KPKKMAIKKIAKPKTKTIKVSWSKAPGNVTGYHVQIATNKKFTKGKKSYYVKKSTSTAKTITKLKKGTKYYVRLRAYKTVGKTKYYGAYSKVKAVTAK